MSNASNLSTLANVLDDGSDGQFLRSTGSGGVAFDTVAAGAVVYATADLLPLSGFAAGDMAYVTATNRFYINNGSGWYSVSLVNTNPNITSVADASSNTTPFTLATDGTASVITITAADPEEVPLTYGYSVTSGSLNGSTVAQGTGSNTNVFTVTPHASQDATFTITFTASDGINQATSANVFSLSFVTIVADSNHTTLLATATGTSDNNNITDSSSNSHSITVNGDAHAGTFSPYRSGGYSTYFDGTGDYLTAASDASFDFGTGNFTIETWINIPDVTSTWSAIISRAYSATGGWRLYKSTGNSNLRFYYTGNSYINATSTGLTNNTWHHIAVVRNSGTITIYVDGASKGSGSDGSTSLNPGTYAVEIGSGVYQSSYPMTGYLRDLRIVKGTAITPPSGGPTERLEAVTNTSLLTCHLPYIADGSTNDHSITVNGDVSTKPFSPYDYAEYASADHGGSVYFDGSGDYLSTPNPLSLSGDFTVSAWVYPEGTSKVQVVASPDLSPNNQFFIDADDFMGTYDGNTTNNAQGVSVKRNAWNYLVWSRTGSSLNMYVNGQQASNSPSSTNTYNLQRIGVLSTYVGYMLGYISDLQIKTSSTSAANAVPPTAPLSSSGTSLHIKGTDASIIDKSQGANLKLVGNTTGSTTQVKFSNTKSMYFDGSGDYISLDANNDLLDLSYGNGDFTVEGWFYFNSLPTSASNAPKLYIDIDSSTAYWQLYLLPSGLTLRANNTGIYITESTITWSTNTWYHISLSRSASTYSVHVGGDRVINTTTTHQIGNHASKTIGGTNTSSAQSLNGYIQDFRITKGLARYTAADETSNIPSAPLEG